MKIEWIQKCVKEEKYYYSKHADQERAKDNLTFTEIEEAISNGIVLENYDDTGRGKSCLLAGFTKSGKPIHVCCGQRGEWLAIITVYIPTPPKFKNAYQRGEK
jgi:hypothetical protein